MTSNTIIWPHAARDKTQPTRPGHVWLRLMETTDVHGHLMPYDYNRGQEVTDYGLARIATLVDQARTETTNSLLFDNGDFLQGSPLSDLVAGPDSDWYGPNPIIAAMNAMGYDAACLGNHEFNFGLDWLDQTLKQAKFPITCANALWSETKPHDRPTFMPPSHILARKVTDSAGDTHILRIGVLGLLPPQITTWDHTHLDGRIVTKGIVETARTEVPRLHAAGAQIIVALTHSGVTPLMQDPTQGPRPDDPTLEHAALVLAQEVPGIDAILAGHSHQILPDPLKRDTAPRDVDSVRGSLNGVPTVLAGYRGSHLGVIDLCLVPDSDRGWSVAAFNSEVRQVAPQPGAPPIPAHPAIVATVRDAHEATCRLTTQPITHTPRAIHSYFAQFQPCPSLMPVLAAQRDTLTKALQGTKHAKLPVLSATAPFKTGGNAGPGYYVDIPAGPLTLGNLTELYPFPNTLVGLRVSGADLTDWLERAASCFLQISATSEARPQPLWNPEFSGHAFDTILGLTYKIDLTQPARYDARGTLLNPGARRVTSLLFNGKPVDPKAEFAVATNNYRAFGGGQYAPTSDDCILHQSSRQISDLLAAHLRLHGVSAEWDDPPTWQLAGPPAATVMLDTGPGLRNHPKDLAALAAQDLGQTPQGFARFAVPLAAVTRVANPVSNAYVSG